MASNVVRMLIKQAYDQLSRPIPSDYDRAVKLYFQKCGDNADQPNQWMSGFIDPLQPDVLVLKGGRGTLARLRYDHAADKFRWL